MVTDTSIEQAVSWAVEQLNELAGQDQMVDAKVDAQLLLCSVIGQNTAYLFTWPEKIMAEQQLKVYQQLIKRRKTGEPVAYLTGERGFWSLDLKTAPCTLIPRPDTECLVEWAMETSLPEQAKILDLGTGTGAIALAIASEKPLWNIHACDVNPQAVELAKLNAAHNNINTVSIVQSNWFAAYGLEHQHSFDLIVSNPPYIDKDDPHLAMGDVRFEPHTALVADEQGMADIDFIVKQTTDFLKPDGWLMIEHGFEQGQKVREVFVQQGFVLVMTKKDYSGHERFTIGSYQTHR
jgi:release factor glutamine methyltransferase